jgi:transcription antitermination factor NusG
LLPLALFTHYFSNHSHFGSIFRDREPKGAYVLFHDSDWFALQVRIRTEHQVATILRAKGYEEFLPTHNTKKKGSSIAAPLFPGYVFCRINSNAHGLIVTTPGVIRIVEFGGKPAPLDPEELRSVQLIVKSGLPTCVWHGVHPGDKVYITEGPLQGVVGVLTSIRAKQRLVVSITMMMRTVAAEIDPEWVRVLSPDPSVPREPQHSVRLKALRQTA